LLPRIAAWSAAIQYLTLREDHDPSMRKHVANIRCELARLEGEPAVVVEGSPARRRRRHAYCRAASHD